MSAPDEPRHDESPERGSPNSGSIVGPAPTAPMDDLSSRPTVALPTQRGGGMLRPGSGRRRAPLVVAAAFNALWAALLSFLPVLGIVAGVTLLGSARPPLDATSRYALSAWLLAHGVALRVAGGPFTVVPLLLTALIWWRLVRAGGNTVRAIRARGSRSWRTVMAVAVVIAMGYGGLGFGSAVLARGPALDAAGLAGLPGSARAGLTLALFGGVASALGAGSATAATRHWWWRLPAIVRDGARGAVVGVCLLIAAGALATGIAIAAAGGKADDVLHGYHTGTAGQAGLIAVCLVYAPNVAIWAGAFLSGPGFTLTVVPALPVFAGLPDRAVTGFGQLLLLIPLVIGIISGIALARRRAVARRVLGDWRLTLPMAVIAGLLSAALLTLASYLAAGQLGNGLLIGQVGWQFPALGGVGIGAGMLVGLNAARLTGVRRQP